MLADEGPFGTVYVANRGLPFWEEQVDALSRIGKSSKPPGEAIGNKGLGFRSVSHVCDAPEIYSQRTPGLTSPAFDGFCFTLEHGRALNGYFDDPRVGQLAESDLPMFSVPRWLTEQPRRVRGFAERGFASVVRLVLRDVDARADALGQFRLLMNQSVPTLLFMERLCRLTALVEGAESPSPDGIVLTRSETPLSDSPLKVSIIDLGRQGTFLLTKAPVAEQAMTGAIDAGVATKQLHGSWKEWSGDGEVALAVRTDNGPVAPRLYTFLPMSEGGGRAVPRVPSWLLFPYVQPKGHQRSRRSKPIDTEGSSVSRGDDRSLAGREHRGQAATRRDRCGNGGPRGRRSARLEQGIEP